MYPDTDVRNKTIIHRLVRTFRDTGSVCLWRVLIECQKSWNYGRTDFKQWISCTRATRQQEFGSSIDFVDLCPKSYIFSSQDCALNKTPSTCTSTITNMRLCSLVIICYWRIKRKKGRKNQLFKFCTMCSVMTCTFKTTGIADFLCFLACPSSLGNVSP
jgi:hypothetical protein